MSFDTILVWLNTAAGMVVLWSAICAANHMSLATPWAIRLAHILVGVGAGAVVLAPGYLNRAPTAAELLLVSGMALLTLADRWRRHSRRLTRHAVTRFH